MIAQDRCQEDQLPEELATANFLLCRLGNDINKGSPLQNDLKAGYGDLV